MDAHTKTWVTVFEILNFGGLNNSHQFQNDLATEVRSFAI